MVATAKGSEIEILIQRKLMLPCQAAIPTFQVAGLNSDWVSSYSPAPAY